MNILVLGGTQFVGRHFAESAFARGHEVTLFHRGTKGTGLIAGAQEILGDRTGSLEAISSHQWDAVVDCCGYLPGIVRASAKALRDCCEQYVFVSTISIYDSSKASRLDEMSATVAIGDPNTAEVTGETYGYLKVLCEQAVMETFGDRAFIVRPGLVAGPYDHTFRFPYWVERFGRGGKVLVPDGAERPIQQIDARDLGEFMTLGIESKLSGAYNAAGPTMSFLDMIAECQKLNSSSQSVFVSEEQLARLEVNLWSDLPLAATSVSSSLMQTSSAKATAKGLSYRSFEETTMDTWKWIVSDSDSITRRPGLTWERESQVLALLASEG